MGTFQDSLGMTSYTLAILFFALKPKVKKLFSIEFVISIPLHSQKHNQKNIGHRMLTQKSLRKDLIETRKLTKSGRAPLRVVGPHRDYETAFCSLAFMVIKIF
jgi:hypothetical protein